MMFNRLLVGMFLLITTLLCIDHMHILIFLTGLSELIYLYRTSQVDWKILLAGMVYLGMFICISWLYLLPFKLILLHAVLSDIGGYVIGSQYGSIYFVPAISPKKTIEGVLGSIVFCVLFGIALKFYNGWWLILSLLICLLSILGDLLISAVKRSYHLKDSSELLQSHGGIWDRIDSILLPVILCGWLVKVILCL